MKNFIDLTPGSTGAVNAAILRYMPPDEAKIQLAICDQSQAQQREVEQLRAEVQRLTPDDAHARDCKTQQKEALVLSALDNADLLARVVAAIPCHKIALVMKHLNYYKDDHGAVKKRYDIKKAPCHKTVKAILQKHGYL